jgi:endonuclease/exonuclease/phosphatase family metal-dependent hydrolase
MQVIIKKKKRKTLKIISFNIKSCQECNIEELIDYFKLKKVDIICLQEVDLCSKYCPVNICELIGKKLGFQNKYLKTINRKQGGSYGISIFSKYNIISYKEYYYDKYDEKRGMQEIEIFVPQFKRNIKIFNTHLDYKSSRNYQVKQCLDIISNYNNYDCMLCGDLNLNPTESIYNLLSEKFKNIVYNNTYSSKRPTQILDYILLNKGSNLNYEYNVENVKLSDHKPLICKIKVVNDIK